MKKDCLISVIIPAFNGEKYVAQCIENMLNQTYKNLEVIVVDDGSTDNTAEIAGRYPVKLIQQENQGVSAARNTGIKAATGCYLHFMDIDDIINLEFYENMLEAALSVDADMACCGLIHERLHGLSAVFSEKYIYVNTADKIAFTKVGPQSYAYKYLFRVSFLKENNLFFNTELCYAEDKVFSLQAVYFANRIISVPNAVYTYKYRRNSAMTTTDKEIKRKRSEHFRRANEICSAFALEHHLGIIENTDFITYTYKILGIPLLKKRIFDTGRIRWYLLGIYIIQRKRTR